MRYICNICDKVFDEVLEDAQKLVGSRGTSVVYKFSDGTIHDLKPDRSYSVTPDARQKKLFGHVL